MKYYQTPQYVKNTGEVDSFGQILSEPELQHRIVIFDDEIKEKIMESMVEIGEFNSAKEALNYVLEEWENQNE